MPLTQPLTRPMPGQKPAGAPQQPGQNPMGAQQPAQNAQQQQLSLAVTYPDGSVQNYNSIQDAQKAWDEYMRQSQQQQQQQQQQPQQQGFAGITPGPSEALRLINLYDEPRSIRIK